MSSSDDCSQTSTDDSDANALKLRPKKYKKKRTKYHNTNSRRNQYNHNERTDLRSMRNIRDSDTYHSDIALSRKPKPSSKSYRQKTKKTQLKHKATPKTSKSHTKTPSTPCNDDNDKDIETKANKTANTNTRNSAKHENHGNDKNDGNALKECWKYCDWNISCCVVMYILMFCVIYIPFGYGYGYAATLLINAEQYENEATKELCLIKTVESEECIYNCYGKKYKYTATAEEKCGDLILNQGEVQHTCPGDEYDIDTKQMCYVKKCEDEEFIFSHNTDLYIFPIVMIVVLTCWCGICSFGPYIICNGCIRGESMSVKYPYPWSQSQSYMEYPMKPCCILSGYGVKKERVERQQDPEESHWY